MWWVEIGWLNQVALRCRESHISDSILTSWEEAHGNAGTAWCRSSRRIAGLETFASGKQNKGLFSAARYHHSVIISAVFGFLPVCYLSFFFISFATHVEYHLYYTPSQSIKQNVNLCPHAKTIRKAGENGLFGCIWQEGAYHGALPRLGLTRDIVEQCRRLKGSRLV